METFADKLARLAVIATAEQPLPRDLGEWACAAIRELAAVRASVVPASLARDLRDRRILAAADAMGAGSPWAAATALRAEASRVERTWHVLRLAEPAAGTVAGELAAARRWQPLPDSERTFFRLLTKTPLSCQSRQQ